MSLGLHPDESKFAAYLQTKGLGDVSARVLSVAVCRRYCLSRDEFIAALEYHIINKPTIVSAVDDLLKRGLLSTIPSQQEYFIQATEPWEQAFLKAFNSAVDTDMTETVNNFRKRRESDLIERVGWAGRVESRQAFHDAISQARSRIRLGVYSSKTVFPEIANAIKAAML
ncbi:MAG: hypothetical protein N2559_16440, partial [Anaerolineae bacterium]|nr:hypothetical protein [Anaerolineae bacterium]